MSGIYERSAAVVCDLRHIFAHLGFGSQCRYERSARRSMANDREMIAIPDSSRNQILQRRSEPRERLGHALKCSVSKMDADFCIQTESLARTYERPALRKAFAALLADTKVA